MPKQKKLTYKHCSNPYLEPGMHPDITDGLYLEVKKSGTRSWAFIYQLKGRRRQMGLGPFPAVSLADARQRAVNYHAMLKRDKVDPMEIEGQRRSSLKTFQQYADEFIDSNHKGWENAKSPQQWRNTLREYVFPKIGRKPVQEITSEDVLRILKPIWKTKHETAYRLRGRIHNVIDYAEAHGAQIVKNPAAWAGNLKHHLPAKGEFKAVKHFRALEYKDAPELMSDLLERGETTAYAMIWLITTASRVGSVVQMKWDQINYAMNSWDCPAEIMKGGDEFRVPLSKKQMDWLGKFPKLGELVFPSTKDTSLSTDSLRALLRRMMYREGKTYLDETTTHGLRSTFRTWAGEQTNYQTDLIELALAHDVGTKVRQAYDRGEYLEKRRKLMGEWQQYIGFSSY